MRSALDNNSLSSDQDTNLFLVGLSKRLGNLLNLTNPLATEDSGSRTRVPNLITRPQVGRLLVFHFKTRDTQPEPNHLSFPTKYYEFPTRSGPISTNPVRFQIDLVESSQILTSVINPRPTQINPKPTRLEPKNPTKSLGQFRAKFLSTCLIKVKSEFGTNPTWLNLWTTLIFYVGRN